MYLGKTLFAQGDVLDEFVGVATIDATTSPDRRVASSAFSFVATPIST
jgi:hypothetical protein